MSEDKTPQRPEGLTPDASSHVSPAPRVEVEPTPVPPAGAAADAAATTQLPGAAGAHAASGTTTGFGASAGSPSQTTTMPNAAQAVPQETVTRTVVKTKTKMLPVFLASLAGFAVGAVLLVALVMSGAFRITDTNVETTDKPAASQSIKIDPEDTTLAETVSAKALPSVVSITAQSEDGGGVGSGVILDKDGNILTNYHVVEGATDLAVALDGGESYEAEIVGTDESSDLAVIRLKDAKDADLTPIEIGDSDNLNVGEWVMAIGSPFGNEQSVSTGIVSALYRSTALPSTSGTSIYANMIQTDAAINPGNSGGALVNDHGELIGINSVIESYSGSSSGVGFAIPVNYAMNIANQIIDGKTPVHPYLGVTLTSVNALSARKDDLSVNEGARVVEVAADGPADKAGLKTDDIITKIDDTDVSSADSLIIAMRTYEVGDKVTLTVVRGGDEKKVEVTLGSDEDLQKEQDAAANEGDNVQGDGSGNSMSEEDFLRYLEELMGRGQNGDDRGYGNGQDGLR